MELSEVPNCLSSTSLVMLVSSRMGLWWVCQARIRTRRGTIQPVRQQAKQKTRRRAEYICFHIYLGSTSFRTCFYPFQGFYWNFERPVFHVGCPMDSLRDSLREITKTTFNSWIPSSLSAPKNKEQTKCHTTDTPLKSIMEPKHGGLEDNVHFQLDDFEVPC